MWDALLPADRLRIAGGTRQPRPAREQWVDPPRGGGVRLVADVQGERRRAMAWRACRDAGSLVTVALLGLAVAVHVDPPATRLLVLGAAGWLLALLAAAQRAVRQARGAGVTGSAEGNAAYFADPERFALGGSRSLAIGAGLGTAIMLVALLARAI